MIYGVHLVYLILPATFVQLVVSLMHVLHILCVLYLRSQYKLLVNLVWRVYSMGLRGYSLGRPLLRAAEDILYSAFTLGLVLIHKRRLLRNNSQLVIGLRHLSII